MKITPKKIKDLARKSYEELTSEGLGSFMRKTKNFIAYRLPNHKPADWHFADILFINGCPIDYCERYRVHHKMEELKAFGITCDEIQAHEINEEIIKYYRGFVIYRQPWTESFDNFVKLAHENNKVVFYDIDDLVFDLKFTKSIKQLETFSKEQLDEYNDGVVRYGKMLDICDYGITTTNIIADEMKKRVKDACIDKNIASLDMQKYSNLAIKEVKKNKDKVIIGYSSGSITHNDDFEMVLPSLLKLIKKYDNVYLKIIGVLTLPDELKPYKDRIELHSFVNYKNLPALLRSIDINLAPLRDTFFNKAKSSIKWMEAGLVKIPTVASDVGNFHDCITDGHDGILAKENEWFEKLEQLVTNVELREKIGNNAYKTVRTKFTAIHSGKTVSDFIMSKLNRNICFILPGVNISGGVMVAVKHAIMLKNQGYDVSMINIDEAYDTVERMTEKDEFINVISRRNARIDQHIDTAVATMWLTLPFAQEISNCQDVRYLVQNFEPDFYEPNNQEILAANSTYNQKTVQYLTISKWVEDWLKKDYDKKVKFAPNGIDLDLYHYKKRSFKGKIHILVEGDCKSHYKNVDEAFRIINELDPKKFEISYLSYNGEPKKWYRVDHLYHKVPHDQVGKIYEKNDILLKTSLLESFSYPPLEMMATGGFTVAIKNDGNKEFLKNEENCLFYHAGDIKAAVEKINLLIKDKALRDKLEKNGLETAKQRSWRNIKKDIIALYAEEKS